MAKEKKDNIDLEELVNDALAASEADEVKSDEGDTTAGDDSTAKIQELEDKLLRLQAEFQNYKKRSSTDMFAARDRAIADTAEKLLGTLDALENVKSHLPEDNSDHKKGLEGFIKLMDAYVSGLAIETLEIVPGETAFDPTFHEAIGSEETEGKSDIILDVYQRGYKRGEMILRTAKVKVGI